MRFVSRTPVGVVAAAFLSAVAAVGCSGGGPTSIEDIPSHAGSVMLVAGESKHAISTGSANNFTRVRIVVDLDWGSAANDVIMRIYRSGDADPDVGSETCRLPPAPRAERCPVVASATSSAKPKRIDVTFDQGRYNVIVTNRGPGAETVRSEFRVGNPDE